MRSTLSAVDPRKADRHLLNHQVMALHHRLGEIGLSIANISASGFMATVLPVLRRGDRVALRLPVIGWIEAHVKWQSSERSGFQFERLIRADDYAELLVALDHCEGGRENRRAA